jgi:RimJ/RimL family protein N-acetyltransferase
MAMSAAVSAGPQVAIRAIAPTDASGLERFYASLSEESRILRFLGWTAGLGTERSQAFCTADHEHREGFVAVDGDEIVGHLCIEPDGAGSAEVAIAVADRLHGKGIGHRLLAAGVAWGRQAGLRRFTATAFAWNTRLLRLVRGLGLPARFGVGSGGTCEIRIDLAAGLPAAA